MSESPYVAMREFIRVAVELEVRKAIPDLKESLTREAPKIIEGPPGKDGRDGKDGVNGKDGQDGKPGELGQRGADGVNGKDGRNGDPGKDGAPSAIPGPKGDKGERGADGIATREELNAIVEQRFAEIQVRTFADVYQGVYENGRNYERGLLATWGGSLWLSQAETRSKPGESPDWRLVVKKGADARK